MAEDERESGFPAPTLIEGFATFLKYLDRIRRLLRRNRQAETPPPIVIPEKPIAAVDETPEWRKKIAIINARCEERKREMAMLKGGRMITFDDTSERIN